MTTRIKDVFEAMKSNAKYLKFKLYKYDNNNKEEAPENSTNKNPVDLEAEMLLNFKNIFDVEGIKFGENALVFYLIPECLDLQPIAMYILY